LQSNQWIAPQQSGSQPQQQQQSQGSSEQGGKGKPQAKNKKKSISVQNNLMTSSDGGLAQMNYTNSICMCCGEPGHHQATCSKTAMCFICKATNHAVENCPMRKRPHQMAKYIGSAVTGLAFYHIEIPEVDCGVVLVEGGEITAEELAAEFSKIYKTNWPWQIRDLAHAHAFLVKFSPHINVEQVIGYPRFGLSKGGIWVKIEAWNDDPEPVEVLSDVWIKVSGLQSKWCEWNTLDQAISPCGILRDVDWLSVFRNNAQEVRLFVSCRDPSKVLEGRLFEFHKNLFTLGFTV
jgi:hypothetical protein